MKASVCTKCCSHYMNGDDYWCDYYNKCCNDVPDNCDYFDEFIEP